MSKQTGEKPILVKAIHAYSPANNDELKLEKGDIITLTQKEEGGWWEGTLSGKTGWFPSNYVEDYNPAASSSGEAIANGKKMAAPVVDTAMTAQQAEYRRIVLADLIESETAHLAELQGMWDNFLQPLGKADLLTPTEYKILVGNLPDVIQCHSTNLLNALKSEQSKPSKEQRVGKIFLENAPRMESFHKVYCGNHPKAVQVIEKHKEELADFIEAKGGRSPGVLVLIVALSQPFRRMEKYPAMLQELERHVEEFHKDRGDLQRSIEYYKEIDKSCCALRKQKEMELEVLSGAIKDWEGTDVAQLGEIIFMNMVYIGFDRQPRYFVLFPNTLLILSYNPENNSLVYEGKIPVSGITLISLPDKETLVNAFEVAGPMIDQILISCSTKQLKETWLQHLNKILKSNRFPSFGSSPQQSFGHLTPPVQAWNIARLRPAPPFNPFLAEYFQAASQAQKSHSFGNVSYQSGLTSNSHSHNQNQTTNSHFSPGNNSSSVKSKTASSISTTSLPNGSSGSRTSINYPSPVSNEDDFTVLTIVDAFCAKNRQLSVSIGAANNSPPKVTGNGVPEKLPRTLAQLVLSIRDEVTSLKSSIMTMQVQLEEEQRARKALQMFVQNHVSPIMNGGGGHVSSTASISVD